MKLFESRLGNLAINADSRRVPLNATQRTVKTKKKLYPYIGANNILCYIDEYIFNEEILCIAEDGGSWGKNQKCAFLYNEKCWVNNHAHVLCSNEKGYLPYLMHYLNYANLKRHVTGSTRGKLTRKKLDSIIIPTPKNFDDQIRIATILSRAENLIAKRKESIELLDELLKSTFWEMFGFTNSKYKNWKTEPLLSSTNIVSGVTKGKKYNDKNLIETPYMRVANVQDGYFNLKEIKTITVSKKEYERFLLLKGDVLLTEGGDPDKLGRGSVWEERIPNCIHQNHIFRVRIKNIAELNPYFLSALIGSMYGKKYFLKAAKQTTGIASINSTQLKKFPLILPPIDLQNKFAQIVEKVEFIKSKYQQSLTELENLYGALSQRAFKGELDLSKIPVKNEPETIIGTMELTLPSMTMDGKITTHKPFSKQELLNIIKSRGENTFNFNELWDDLEKADFIEMPTYDEIKDMVFIMLEDKEPILSQSFDEDRKEIVLKGI